MEKASPLIEFKTVFWSNFEFAGRESIIPIMDEGWCKLTEAFPLVIVSIPIHSMGDPNPRFLQQPETWCCTFYRWSNHEET